MIQIEFFHDVICSFCFPMSYRMRKIAKKYNNIEIIHRSFALGWEAEVFIRSFGSREAVKTEVLGHWQHANEIDDEHRFNIEGMRQTGFNFPTSRLALIAAKAAGLKFGQDAYWEVFDKLQYQLFVENQNIEDIAIIEAAIRETSIDFEAWQAQFKVPDTEEAVLEDLALANYYGVYSAPSLIINQKYSLSGAQPQEVIEKTLETISQEEGLPLNKLVDLSMGQGQACQFIDGQWECDPSPFMNL